MSVLPQAVLDQLEGATITSWRIEEDGLYLQFADGRAFVIAGFYCISLVKPGLERLH